MADFRKWLLVLSVVLITAVSASAAPSIQNIPCTTTNANPYLRTGGVTEYIGEVDLNCNSVGASLNAGQTLVFQLSLTLNAVVTNATAKNGIDNLGPLTMAAAVVQDQTAPQTILETVQGRVYAPNILKFPGVVVPLGTTFTIRFINVRVAAIASTLVGTVANPFGVTQVYGVVNQDTVNQLGWSLNITGQGAEGLLVGTFAPLMKFAVTDCVGNAASPSISFQQCITYDLERDNPGNVLTPVYGVTFTELTPTAFKNIVEEDGATIPAAGGGPEICDTGHDGTNYVAVFDDVPPIPPCTPPAWVSNGSRLIAQFKVPTALNGNIKIWVTRYPTSSPTSTYAELVSAHSDVGWGIDSFTWEGPDINCPKGSYYEQDNPFMLLYDDGSGNYTATWEVENDNIANLESITFGWAITYKETDLPSLPDVGGVAQSYPPITLQGNMGPIATDKVIGATSLSSEPVVRFIAAWQPGNVTITVDHCVTDLLFPYVTNIFGYNTGIAIANTSLDSAWNNTPAPTSADPTFGTASDPLPYDTTPQAGPCALFLFGSSLPQNMAGSGTAVQAIASGLTPNVAAGQVFADTLTNIFALNAGKTPITMSGYVIARCQFQFGHGYAYVVNPSGFPQSYLALVIPDRNVLNADTNTGFWHSTPIRIAQPMSNSEYDEQGEQLAQ